MKKIYTIWLKGKQLFMVREDHNTIGVIHKTLEKAKRELAGEMAGEISYAISVNEEVLSHGESLGMMTNVEEVKE